jgi:hypothetical protein
MFSVKIQPLNLKSLIALAGLVIILCLTAGSIFAEDPGGIWYGGQARLASLGGITTAIPDAAGTLDLYEEGFVSSLALRPGKNIIDLDPGAMPHDKNYNTGEISSGLHDLPVLLNMDNTGPEGIVLFFGDSALQFIPHFSYNEGQYDNGENFPSIPDQLNYSRTLFSADIRYAKKIGQYFSGGAALRNVYYRDDENSGWFGYLDHDAHDITGKGSLQYVKAEYSISATYSPDRNLQAAVSFGSLKNLLPSYQNWIVNMNTGGLSGAFNIYTPLIAGFNVDDSEQIFDTTMQEQKTINTGERQNISGYDLNAGCSILGQGCSIFTVSAGLSAGISGEFILVSSTADSMIHIPGAETYTSESQDFKRIQDGESHHVTFKCRYDFGGIIAAGKFAYQGGGAACRLDGPLQPPTAVNLQIFDVVLGATFKPEKFSIPAEIFMQNFLQTQDGGPADSLEQYTLFTAGLRGGLEYEIDRGIYLRTGINFAYGGPGSFVRIPGQPDKSSLFGTSYNPAYTQFAVCMGAGHYSGNFELNMNISYGIIGEIPQPQGDEFNEHTVSILTDIKVYL